MTIPCVKLRALFSNLGIGPGNLLLGVIATLFIPMSSILYKVSLGYLGAPIQGAHSNIPGTGSVTGVRTLGTMYEVGNIGNGMHEGVQPVYGFVNA